MSNEKPVSQQNSSTNSHKVSDTPEQVSISKDLKDGEDVQPSAKRRRKDSKTPLTGSKPPKQQKSSKKHHKGSEETENVAISKDLENTDKGEENQDFSKQLISKKSMTQDFQGSKIIKIDRVSSLW